MRVRPTELGLKGILLLAALELAFLATSYSNLFFLLIAFCCVLGVLGLAWGIANVRPVHAELLDVAAAPAGSPHELRLRLEVRGRARFDLGLRAKAATAGEVLHLPIASGDAVIDAVLPAQPRGVHALTELQVTSRFPFGLLQVTRRIAVQGEVVAHPSPVDLGGLTARGGAGSELARALASLASLQRSNAVASLRPFRSGDSPADIHWKATARRGTPIVKERDGDSGTAIEIVVDRRCTADELETALSMATAVVLAASAEERIVTLRSQGCAGDFGEGRQPLRAALRWLALAEALPATAAPPPRATASALRLPLRQRREVAHA